MPTHIAYALKIKIVSLHFRIRALNGNIQLQLFLGQRLLAAQQIQLQYGLIMDSATLKCTLTASDIDSNQKMQIVLTEDNSTLQQKVGNICISFEEFRQTKMKVFPINNCFDTQAYLEAFLLLLPTKIIELQQQYDQTPILIDTIQPNFQKILSASSLVDIHIEEEERSENLEAGREQSARSHFQESSQVTFSAMDRASQSQNNSYEVNTQSLMTLNEILNETNNHLSTENDRLKQLVEDLLMRQKIKEEITENNEKMVKEKIDCLQLQLKEKDKQLVLKCQEVDELKQSQKSKVQATVVITSQKKEVKSEDLMKQVQFWKKYKEKGTSKKDGQVKMASSTKIPMIKLGKLQFFRQGPKSSRMHRQTAKNYTIAKDKDTNKNDETLDTTKQVNSAMSIK